LGRIVDHVRYDRAALVLLMTIPSPGPNVEAVLPGVRAAANRYNRVFERVAAGKSDVVVVDSADLAADTTRMTPDGIHYSVEGHRLVGDALSKHIIAWHDDVWRTGP
jgi:hypothetical protein